VAADTLVKEGKQAVRAYDTLVQAGVRNAKALAEARWNLGRLALEVAPELSERGGARRNDAAASFTDTLQGYAKDIGIDYVTLREYRRVVEAWGTPVPPEGLTSWEMTRELAHGANDEFTPQDLLDFALKLAEEDGRDEVNRDDVREVRGKATAHDRTLPELFNTAGLKVEAATRRVQENWTVMTMEGKEGMERLQALEDAIVKFKEAVKQ